MSNHLITMGIQTWTLRNKASIASYFPLLKRNDGALAGLLIALEEVYDRQRRLLVSNILLALDLKLGEAVSDKNWCDNGQIKLTPLILLVGEVPKVVHPDSDAVSIFKLPALSRILSEPLLKREIWANLRAFTYMGE